MIDRVAAAWSDCTRCPLAANRCKVVNGRGGDSARLMIIGEAPGADEDQTGLPFIGAAGEKLKELAKDVLVDLDSDEIFITNTVACRPQGNRTPTTLEMAACRPRLDALVAAIKPRAILLLGLAAMGSIAQMQVMGRNRGRWVDTHWQWKGKWTTIDTMATWHPAFLLRDPDPRHIEHVKDDIRSAYDRSRAKTRT